MDESLRWNQPSGQRCPSGECFGARAEQWIQRLGIDRVALVVPLGSSPDDPVQQLARARRVPLLSLAGPAELATLPRAAAASPAPPAPWLCTDFQLDREHRLPDDAYIPGLRDLLLRPLSAQRLPPTLPEREGWVDRQRLHGFVGTSRKGLIALARQFGFPYIPSPSTGCALTEQGFGRKVPDLIQLHPTPARWDVELLKLGRHYLFDDNTKVVVGRNDGENARLEWAAQQSDAPQHAAVRPHTFRGPVALAVGRVSRDALEFAASLVARHAKVTGADELYVEIDPPGAERLLLARRSDAVDALKTISGSP